jgi:hypothetical protein
VPDHVVAHYTGLDDAAIFEAVVAHQHRLWPAIRALAREYADTRAGPGLVLEGSAIMPGDVAAHPVSGVAALWLTASDDFVRERIEGESRYRESDASRQFLIDRFIERNRRLDALYRDGARQFGFPVVDVEAKTLEVVGDLCLAAAGIRLQVTSPLAGSSTS